MQAALWHTYMGKITVREILLVNCHSQVDITVNKVKKSGTAAGGIAGYADNNLVSGMFQNQGQVQIASEERLRKHYAGGLVGCVDSGVSVRQSFNSGYAGSFFYCAGGIAALVKGGNCEFTSNYNSGEVGSKNYAGGLAEELMTGQAEPCFPGGILRELVNLNQSACLWGRCLDMQRPGITVDYMLWREQPLLLWDVLREDRLRGFQSRKRDAGGRFPE